MAYENDIFNTAISDGMPRNLALLIVAQAKHETGNFTSNIFLNCLNAFGYKTYGNAFACPGNPTYEGYNSVIDSTHEITGWIKRRLNEGNFPDLETITDPYQYATLLKNNGYFGDSVNNYANGIISWYKDNINRVGSLWAIAGIFGVVYLFTLKKKNKKNIS